MNLKDLIPIVGEFAPEVATALGSPIAGLVVSALCAHAGVSPTPEALQHFAVNNKQGMTQAVASFMTLHGDIIKSVAAAAAGAPDMVDSPGAAPAAVAVPVDTAIATDVESLIAKAADAPFALVLQLWRLKFLLMWAAS